MAAVSRGVRTVCHLCAGERLRQLPAECCGGVPQLLGHPLVLRELFRDPLLHTGDAGDRLGLRLQMLLRLGGRLRKCLALPEGREQLPLHRPIALNLLNARLRVPEAPLQYREVGGSLSHDPLLFGRLRLERGALLLRADQALLARSERCLAAAGLLVPLRIGRPCAPGGERSFQALHLVAQRRGRRPGGGALGPRGPLLLRLLQRILNLAHRAIPSGFLSGQAATGSWVSAGSSRTTSFTMSAPMVLVSLT